MLRDLLNIPIKEVTIDNSTITEKELLDDKVGVMDIQANIDFNTQIYIEMQVVNQCNIEERLMFYWSKLFSKSIKQGNGYDSSKKTIVIMIADFKLEKLKTIEKYQTKWNMREEDYSSIVLTDVVQVYIIELPKFERFAKNSKSENLNLWTKFIKNPEVKIMDENTTNNNDNIELQETKQAILEAQEKLRQISASKHEQELADLREKYIRDQYNIELTGYERGKSEGEVKGKLNEKKEIARKMLKDNLDLALIMQYTGLTKEEIEDLK